jgi:cyclopropane fatty-acyl-phospholipid synthase-like methyltransferase
LDSEESSSPPHGPVQHPSSSWRTCWRKEGNIAPADPAKFAEAMRHQSFPRASAYDPAWVYRNLMGPNALWLLDGLTQALKPRPEDRILDLGCGSAITSIFLAREFGVQVWAADLWVEASENNERIIEAGVFDRVFPIEAEAHALPFAHAFFDGVVSIDAYHYFGTDVRYLSYLAQFVKPGGFIAITVPGNGRDPDEADVGPPPALARSLGADWFTFRSAAWWKRHWNRTEGVEVELAQMAPDGWALWRQYLEAAAAWNGTSVVEQGDGPMLLSEEGRSLGFARVIARRLAEPTLVFGPGRYRTRLA